MLFAKDITNKNINDAISFCLPYEATCINLVCHLLKLSKNSESPNDDKNKEETKKSKILYLDEKIIGVFCVNSSNMFLYCIPLDYSSVSASDVFNLLLTEFNFSCIFAIMGEAIFQAELLRHLRIRGCINGAVTAKYLLMTKKKDSSCSIPQPLLKGVKIRRALLKDAGAILPLQRLYEKEEVCKESAMMSERLSLLNLEKTLQNETVFIATYNGEVLAKANTNSRGAYWEQIGGIYTAKKYRRLLIGSYLVATLTEHIQKEKNKNVALFVRQENDVAIKMYQKLLFARKEEFYINYLK